MKKLATKATEGKRASDKKPTPKRIISTPYCPNPRTSPVTKRDQTGYSTYSLPFRKPCYNTILYNL